MFSSEYLFIIFGVVRFSVVCFSVELWKFPDFTDFSDFDAFEKAAELRFADFSFFDFFSRLEVFFSLSEVFR